MSLLGQRGRPEARGRRQAPLGLGRAPGSRAGATGRGSRGCGATLGRLGLRVARAMQGPVPLRAGPKGKGGAPAPAQGKGRGKGKGNARHGATDAAAAKRELAQFLQLHGDFTFRPRPAPPAEILTVYDELYEGSLGLYKHMARHMRTPAALAILHQEILPEMARESHWRVDKQNHVEKNRRDSRELGASRLSRSSVSRASGWTSRTFGT